MKVSFRRIRKRAFTLVELLFAMALFVGLVGGLSYTILRSVRAHEFENAYREASVCARTAIDRLADEMRAGYPILDCSNLSGGSFQVPSAVWFPDCYGSTTSPFTGIYLQNIVKMSGETHKTTAHVAYNRVIFTRPMTASEYKDAYGVAVSSITNLDALNNFVYVDWFVPANHRDRIYRVVHKVTLDSYHCPSQYALSNAESFFGTGTDLGRNDTIIYGSDKISDFIVAQLPQENDVFSFAVSHTPLRGIYGFTDFYDDAGNVSNYTNGNGAKYEPGMFKIDIKACVHSHDHSVGDGVASGGGELPDENNAFLDGSPTAKDSSSPTKRVVTFTEEVLVKQR